MLVLVAQSFFTVLKYRTWLTAAVRRASMSAVIKGTPKRTVKVDMLTHLSPVKKKLHLVKSLDRLARVCSHHTAESF